MKDVTAEVAKHLYSDKGVLLADLEIRPGPEREMAVLALYFIPAVMLMAIGLLRFPPEFRDIMKSIPETLSWLIIFLGAVCLVLGEEDFGNLSRD